MADAASSSTALVVTRPQVGGAELQRGGAAFGETGRSRRWRAWRPVGRAWARRARRPAADAREVEGRRAEGRALSPSSLPVAPPWPHSPCRPPRGPPQSSWSALRLAELRRASLRRAGSPGRARRLASCLASRCAAAPHRHRGPTTSPWAPPPRRPTAHHPASDGNRVVGLRTGGEAVAR
uniref:Uncharacterized protein n=1 Tax=Arundo donax TaxID=35708 RepID=A0A0A9G2I4_ARUDO